MLIVKRHLYYGNHGLIFNDVERQHSLWRKVNVIYRLEEACDDVGDSTNELTVTESWVRHSGNCACATGKISSGFIPPRGLGIGNSTSCPTI